MKSPAPLALARRIGRTTWGRGGHKKGSPIFAGTDGNIKLETGANKGSYNYLPDSLEAVEAAGGQGGKREGETIALLKARARGGGGGRTCVDLAEGEEI